MSTREPTPFSDVEPGTGPTDVVMPEFEAGATAEDIMATLKDAGYGVLAQTIKLIIQEFPDKAGSFTPERVNGWVTQLQSGERLEDDLRDDIFKFVVTPEDIMDVYGVDEKTAGDIINGANDGGINFGDFLGGFDAGGGVRVRPGAGEEEDPGGVGDPGTEDAPGMTILQGQDMKWHFDKDATNKWFVSYGLPGSDRRAVFEAETGDMDNLFGQGMRPISFESTTFKDLIGKSLNDFSGDISEMEGTGFFEEHYNRTLTLALDGGELPPWAKQDGAAQDILYIANAEDKSVEWMIQQLSKTDSFKQRFPGLEGIMSQTNSNLGEAIDGFLELEAGVKQSLLSVGLSAELVTPATIGALIEKGHSLTTVDTTVKTFDRMKKFAPAMEAFNGILGAQGLDPITELQDMFDFAAGTAPVELYDIWEASTLSEQATLAGLDRFFSADDAIQVALATAGNLTTESVTAAMRKSAELALRLRHDLDVTKFGLNHEDLIDMNLGQPLRSGNSVAEVGANIQRVIQSASANRNKQAQAFTGFSETGVPQARSFGNLRPTS